MTSEPVDQQPPADPNDEVEPRLSTDPDPDPEASPLPDDAPGRGEAVKHPDPEPGSDGA